MEEAIRDVVTRLANGREVLRMASKLSGDDEVIECSDGTRLVLHSGGEKYAEWISGPNRFKQQLLALYGIAANVLQMAVVLGDKETNDDLSEKIESGASYFVQSYKDLQDAVAAAETGLKKARAAVFVMTGIIAEVDDGPVE